MIHNGGKMGIIVHLSRCRSPSTRVFFYKNNLKQEPCFLPLWNCFNKRGPSFAIEWIDSRLPTTLLNPNRDKTGFIVLHLGSSSAGKKPIDVQIWQMPLRPTSNTQLRAQGLKSAHSNGLDGPSSSPVGISYRCHVRNFINYTWELVCVCVFIIYWKLLCRRNWGENRHYNLTSAQKEVDWIIFRYFFVTEILCNMILFIL